MFVQSGVVSLYPCIHGLRPLCPVCTYIFYKQCGGWPFFSNDMRLAGQHHTKTGVHILFGSWWCCCCCSYFCCYYYCLNWPVALYGCVIHKNKTFGWRFCSGCFTSIFLYYYIANKWKRKINLIEFEILQNKSLFVKMRTLICVHYNQIFVYFVSSCPSVNDCPQVMFYIQYNLKEKHYFFLSFNQKKINDC